LPRLSLQRFRNVCHACACVQRALRPVFYPETRVAVNKMKALLDTLDTFYCSCFRTDGPIDAKLTKETAFEFKTLRLRFCIVGGQKLFDTVQLSRPQATMLVKLAVLCLGASSALAFAPSSFVPAKGRASPAVTRHSARSKATTKMALEGIETAQYILGAVPNVPFVDEITGEPQGLTAPLTHFGSVISLWVMLKTLVVIHRGIRSPLAKADSATE
jgi:hypothetical protein